MLEIVYTNSFKKDFKKISKQSKDLNLIKDVIKRLSQEEPLEVKHKDHSLIGSYRGKRECHITPDWLLIYEVNNKNKELVLHRTGSHSELFRK